MPRLSSRPRNAPPFPVWGVFFGAVFCATLPGSVVAIGSLYVTELIFQQLPGWRGNETQFAIGLEAFLVFAASLAFAFFWLTPALLAYHALANRVRVLWRAEVGGAVWLGLAVLVVGSIFLLSGEAENATASATPGLWAFFRPWLRVLLPTALTGFVIGYCFCYVRNLATPPALR